MTITNISDVERELRAEIARLKEWAKLGLRALEYASTGNRLAELIAPAIAAFKQALAEQPAQQTCNCRWEGEVQVQQCTLHEAHVDAIHEWAERAKSAERQFKNFHRLLCERFGYTHDERDWRRDQLSLIEWIAKRAEQPAQQEPVAWMKPHPKCDSACLFQCTHGFTQFPECATTLPAQRPHECSRSHPHENMNAICELRTEIARLTNENARLKAQPQQEPVAKIEITRSKHSGEVDGWAFVERPRNAPAGTYNVYTSPPAQRKLLSDDEIWRFWWSRRDGLSGCEGVKLDDLNIVTKADFVEVVRAVLAAQGIKGQP